MCKYNCESCQYEDCIVDGVTLAERRQQDKFDKDLLPLDPEKRSKRKYEQSAKGKLRQRRYARRRIEQLPHCDSCQYCRAVVNSKGDNDTRLCTRHWQLIDSKVSISPKWCEKRKCIQKEGAFAGCR